MPDVVHGWRRAGGEDGGKELALELEATGDAQFAVRRPMQRESADNTKTEAEQALSAAFAAVARHAAGKARSRSCARTRSTFRCEGLLHRRVEEWKYSDLRALMREAKPLAGLVGASRKATSRRSYRR